MVAVDAAYAFCERAARAHYENFPVASLLIPPRMRRHVAAVYVFARAADDFADEGTRPAAERFALLDAWSRHLQRAAAGAPADEPLLPGEPAETPAIFLALGHTIRECRLPVALFEDLLSAFRQDVTTVRYAGWNELRDYCRRSANPVGRLVLRIAGYDDDRLDGWSDAICTALQLTNFWQDLRVDFDRGRVYLPEEERLIHGAREDDLASGGVTPPWRDAIRAAAQRTRALFDDGRPLCDAVSGRLRYELRATWLGGVRILDRLDRAGYDVVRSRPSLGAIDAPWFAWRLVTWPVAARPASWGPVAP